MYRLAHKTHKWKRVNKNKNEDEYAVLAIFFFEKIFIYFNDLALISNLIRFGVDGMVHIYDFI